MILKNFKYLATCPIGAMNIALVSQGQQNKVVGTRYLKTREICYLIVVDASRLTVPLMVPGFISSDGPRGESFLAPSSFWWLLATLGIPRLPTASFSSLPPSSWDFSLCDSVALFSPLLRDLGGCRARLIPYDLILITSAKTLFLNQVTFRGSERT